MAGNATDKPLTVPISYPEALVCTVELPSCIANKVRVPLDPRRPENAQSLCNFHPRNPSATAGCLLTTARTANKTETELQRDALEAEKKEQEKTYSGTVTQLEAQKLDLEQQFQTRVQVLESTLQTLIILNLSAEIFTKTLTEIAHKTAPTAPKWGTCLLPRLHYFPAKMGGSIPHFCNV
ncbi:hypothetical protein Pelo_6176 [Pelomyxa schiedti]|nr:hypothetical protein Pelo_6176 [Pelomyxa schiedti]